MTDQPKRKTNGKTKPFFVPKPEQRKQVEAMAAYGVPGTEIARVIDIGYTTLKKYFRDELDLGHVKANASVAETCFKMATSGKVPAATFFWLKTRARWRERHEIELSGPDGGAILISRIERVIVDSPSDPDG